MKDAESMHQQLQEHITCFADTDPLKEMSRLHDDDNSDMAAPQWLALAALHGITAGAEKISIRRAADGEVRITARYRDARLPAPSADLADRIIAALGEITHMEGNKGDSQLALGVKDSSLEIGVKVKIKADKKKATIFFPPLDR